jgi:anti-anti-sigma factor
VIELKGDTARVFLTGDLDVDTAPAAIEAIRRALALQPARIVIDLDAVTFLDSTGIHAIVTGYHDAVQFGVGFAIGPAPPRVARVLELTGLSDVLAAEPAAAI